MYLDLEIVFGIRYVINYLAGVPARHCDRPRLYLYEGRNGGLPGLVSTQVPI